MRVILFLVVGFLALAILGSLFQGVLSILLPLVVWMLAGMFAGRLMRGRGYGPLGDILLGLVGGIFGTIILNIFGIHLGGIIGAVVVGTTGAVLFVYVVRLVGNTRFAS